MARFVFAVASKVAMESETRDRTAVAMARDLVENIMMMIINKLSNIIIEKRLW